MDRTLFSEEHDAFRKAFRQFAEREIVPHQARWREQGQVDREVWTKAGKAGFLCPWVEEKYGGAGSDFLASTVIIEELARIYESGFAMGLHSDVVVPYIEAFGNDEQKQRWLPGCCDGTLITAIGMTEPGAGSDLAAIQTTAVKDGDVLLTLLPAFPMTWKFHALPVAVRHHSITSIQEWLVAIAANIRSLNDSSAHSFGTMNSTLALAHSAMNSSRLKA